MGHRRGCGSGFFSVAFEFHSFNSYSVQALYHTLRENTQIELVWGLCSLQRTQDSGADRDIAFQGPWRTSGVEGLVLDVTGMTPEKEALSLVLSLADVLSDLGPIQRILRLVDRDEKRTEMQSLSSRSLLLGEDRSVSC